MTDVERLAEIRSRLAAEAAQEPAYQFRVLTIWEGQFLLRLFDAATSRAEVPTGEPSLTVEVGEMVAGGKSSFYVTLYRPGDKPWDGMSVEQCPTREDAESEATKWREFFAPVIGNRPTAPSGERVEAVARAICWSEEKQGRERFPEQPTCSCNGICVGEILRNGKMSPTKLNNARAALSAIGTGEDADG